MNITNSAELLAALKRAGYLKSERDPLWWPKSGSFEVIVGALLTQQTKWERVEESLENLKKAGRLSLDAISTASEPQLAALIKPSGFYNTKAVRLRQLCINIKEDFGDFETFQEEVDRAWLLSQKGIGMESADSILCYACFRPVMVVDSYTSRLLGAVGYTLNDYMSIQEWLHEGIEDNMDVVTALYGGDVSLNYVYARFHGKIVEFAKEYIQGRKVDLSALDVE